jgi:two-component system cell cycle response regulator
MQAMMKQTGLPADTAVAADEDSPAVRELLAENDTLREKLDYLLDQASRNHSIMCRHQAFDLEIVSAGNFPELISIIFTTLPKISDLDVVTLTLLDRDSDIHTVMRNLGVDIDAFPNLLFVESEAELGPMTPPVSLLPGVYRPAMGPFDERRHRAMFPGTVTPDSVAIVPLLRNRRLIGSLNLGSLDPMRFTPSLGTDFIEHMASIIAICLENVISNEMLKYIGLTDALTGVYNRRYIDRRLLEEIARARRQTYDIACMYIDIDLFKHVNDTHGHPVGDEVLREVAHRIGAELRTSDALGRFGGEEFVVLLIDADLDSAAMVAERIRAGVGSTPIVVDDTLSLTVTVSIGVAGVTQADHVEAAEAMAGKVIAKADHALYAAKQGGRNRVVCCD